MKILRFQTVDSYDIEFSVNIRHSIRRSILLNFGQTIDGISQLRLYFDAELVVVPREQAERRTSSGDLAGYSIVGRGSAVSGGTAMATWHPSMAPASSSDEEECPSIGTLRTYEGGPFVHLPSEWYSGVYHVLQTESPLNCTVVRCRDGEDPVSRFHFGTSEYEPIGEGFSEA